MRDLRHESGVRDGGTTGRRTVSIVFTDLKGSTTLGERLDTESLRVLNTIE